MSAPLTRRSAIGLAAAGAVGMTIAGPVAAASSDKTSLEQAFRRAFAPAPDGGLDVAARLAFLAETAAVVSDDLPFPVDRAGYADHLRFLHDGWETLEYDLHSVIATCHGETGTVSAFYNARGKPKGAGYRLRAGFLTAVCTRTPDAWRAIALHMAPLSAQILDASPS